MELPTPATRTVKQVSYDFSGTSVLITGAGRGSGRCHSLAFAKAGADLLLLDLPEREEFEDTVKECRDAGASVEWVHCDVADEAQVKHAVETAIETHGKIDVLVNNAGMIDMWPAVDMELAVWNRVIDVCLTGTFLCAKHVAKHMIERGGGGKIVNTGSGASLLGVPWLSHYVAAKHGVAGLTKTLALELAEHGITVNYVCPTALATKLMPDGVSAPQVPEDSGMKLGMLTGSWNLLDEGMPMSPEEVTNAVLWLSSDAAGFVTGAGFAIDAGFSCK
jgi:NAD(P)-dependent dehydrogenase (short-subunit alcohol dehydrogenase family)